MKEISIFKGIATVMWERGKGMSPRREMGGGGASYSTGKWEGGKSSRQEMGGVSYSTRKWERGGKSPHREIGDGGVSHRTGKWDGKGKSLHREMGVER